jgi:hypothetical protein
MKLVAALVAFVAGTGCLVGGDVPDVEVNASSLEPVARYQSLARINLQPYLSELGPTSINCYVAGDVDDYKKIHPERTGAGVTLPWGTVIVREVLDANRRITKLTVMAKGPPGYDPSLGDWWFAVTDPAGTPLVENGVPQVGRMAACHGCHLDRPQDDFLFGVPAARM